ncbi:hypothetical protein [Marinobacterium jannaschii]|uniref:hypothetical protein n=1 Tax=Marinobacterium jannaschii TaxID=64970 RepID=UPI0012EBEFE7|nr:hypothetical protein [Marinobacterium jannaschii]
MNLKFLPLGLTLLSISGCAMWSADRYPDGVVADAQFVSEPMCMPTNISPDISGEPSPEWKQRVIHSSSVATRILASQEFAQACQSLRMTRTNGKSVQEVCREMVCSGTVKPSVNFYNKPSTRAIAYEKNGALYINTAKESAGAGGPGNMAHEFTHTLGYTHFSNWSFLGKSSVPYRVGNLVERLAKDAE